ncbi:MAG: RidA family protein [Chloroflexi bacterium]|nr:RidA family protein [Chloroflexota bacterium]
MSNRINISSGAKWEEIFGYSRAVRVGNVIEVAGTAAVDENSELVGEGDMYAQAKYILQKIEWAIQEAGGQMSDVVRTRVFLTDFGLFDELACAHQEVFGEIKPASTAVEAKMVDARMLVEIEATAIVMDVDNAK